MTTGEEQQYDVIVIGAGINGAGIFREAATRGLRTLLIEKDDLGGATSATSSRLIHGGLRYLEHYEFALVRESLRERERLLHAAPHLVRPLPLTLPVYKGHSRGPFMIGLGMIAYDFLSYDKSLPTARMYTKDQALELEPGLEPEGLRAAARYYDAQVDFPERLVVENVIDGVANGGVVLPHTKVTGFRMEAGIVRGVEYVNELSGESGAAQGEVTINVAGPWIDRVLDPAGDFPRYNGGTKGSHIVVEPFPGAPKDALYIEARQDGRPYFIIPWNDLYLIGTTDIRFDGDLDRIVASEDEIAYLLTETNLAIPDAGLGREDVLYTFSGVRPLPYQEEGATGSITRKHIIKDHEPKVGGLMTIIGGKLTTYRSLSEEAVDEAQRKLGRKKTRSNTRKRLLPGGSEHYEHSKVVLKSQAPEWLAPDSAEWLLKVYGVRARDVVNMARENETLRGRIIPGHPAIAAAIPFSFQQEFAATLSDVLLRRTMLALDADAGLLIAEAASRIAADACHWDESRRESELALFCDEIAKQLPRGMENPGQ
jgi:glycerol-3-phosphate dehydrogenase